MENQLARLASYVTPDDTELDQVAFLQIVRDRIEDDLAALAAPCSHVEDNQGLCHNCGILMNPDRAEV